MEKNSLTLPAAIVIAGALIAGAVFYASYTPSTTPSVPTGRAVSNESEINLKAVSADEHILGNPNAQLKIVEFSDTECPFCKTFHTTMQQIVSKYGKTGEIAWIYRHFPLDNIHP
ncbi:MAG: thioredoxin domain-containing protein, partial [Candidatus Paceibacterota bacterium]